MPRRAHTVIESEDIQYKPRDGLKKYSQHNTMSWNWKKCRNCKGTGKVSGWDRKTGRALSLDTCPTCGGLGGWPLYTQPMLDARLNHVRLSPLTA